MERHAQALERWTAIGQFINKWFHQPDMEAVEVSISAAIAHYFRKDAPVWLMILGAPGTGKTSILISCLQALPFSYVQDDLTSSTFLSGLSLGEKNQFSLLHQIGTPTDRSGILLFPDFTTFMTKRSEEREQVMGQLRRIYDGEFDRTTGTGRLSWEGKVTIIAAATPEVERHWTLQRNMGERFLQVRWARGDGISQAEQAVRQVEHERDIAQELRRLTEAFIFPDRSTPRPLPMFTDYRGIGALHLAEYVARMRVHVPRERDGRREIMGRAPDAEAPTRIIKAMGQLARAHATAFQKDAVELSDFKVSRRIALDSVPVMRKCVMDVLLAEPGELGQMELIRRLGSVARTTAVRSFEDMEALGALESNERGVERLWRVTDEFRDLANHAGPILEL